MRRKRGGFALDLVEEGFEFGVVGVGITLGTPGGAPGLQGCRAVNLIVLVIS